MTKEVDEMSAASRGSLRRGSPRRPVVYIASPYTKGDPAMNTHFQCRVFHRLMDDGIVWPVVPLWSHYQHAIYPRRYQDWIAYDLAMLERYDACIRLAAELPELGYKVTESSGADGEVAAFRRMGRPVFFSVEDCYEWAAASPSRGSVANYPAPPASAGSVDELGPVPPATDTVDELGPVPPATDTGIRLSLLRWIPVTERLPPHDETVLYTCDLGPNEGFTYVESGRWEGERNHTGLPAMRPVLGDEDDWGPCSHWMPLPAPPTDSK